MCTFAAAGLALSAVGTLFSVKNSLDQSKAIKNQYKQAQQVSETENALRREDRARKLARIQGEQRALFGASGFDVDDGADIYGETAAAAAREQYNDDFVTRNKVSAYGASASNASQQGTNQAVGTLFNFAGRSLQRG